MTGTLFALVLTTYLTTGEVQESVIDVYPTYSECMKSSNELHISGNCYPVDGIVNMNGEVPARL
ncbi:DUF1482 family protein [Buttiauxella sp. B2]|uniref:DUF1482 family protein n=1 Tax=Buttiauxella sp. B2 TaxID=2587812 RepID=UPI00111DF536|nr:DUF1482 family protein [Buttiauxella sp. B2]TNV22856.1 DUF1482 family protein [Buttiauxella sp. B2]